MSKKYSLTAQINEVKRELEQRAKVYPNLVRSRRMREGQAEYQTGLMRSVLATLEWLKEIEPEVRAFAEARKQSGDAP